MMKTAIISVNNKQNVDMIALGLAKNGYRIISTGGTLSHLRKQGISVTSIETFTGIPEMMSGRVKTLHSSIFSGILARRDNPSDSKDIQTLDTSFIDVVVVNVYPFVENVTKKNAKKETILEHIDIGGISLLRAAAKNYKDVLVLCDPCDYVRALAEIEAIQGCGQNEQMILQQFDAFKLLQAKKAFAYTSTYDTYIHDYFQNEIHRQKKTSRKNIDLNGKSNVESNINDKNFPDTFNMHYTKYSTLCYGENPHQQSALYVPTDTVSRYTGVYGAKQLQGRQLSYNNLRDSKAAIDIIETQLQSIKKIPKILWKNRHLVQTQQTNNTHSSVAHKIAVGVKHGNPCAVVSANTLVKAWDLAYKADTISIFGSIVALSDTVDETLAKKLISVFLEIIIAPKFTKEARKILQKKKHLRLLEIQYSRTENNSKRNSLEYLSLDSALLVQEADSISQDADKLWECVTKKKPTYQQYSALFFAWMVAKWVKSNAIVVAKHYGSVHSTVGIGAGQMNRLQASAIALEQAKHVLKNRLQNIVIASDAFFPMCDSIDLASKYGVRAIIQPGGSIRDQESIDACNKHGISMIMTRTRHFLH